MIEITYTDVFGWRSAVRGMRNPLESWDRSDTHINELMFNLPSIGDNDLGLMNRLAVAGTEHAKYQRFIHVECDIKAPLFWWKEFDTYRAGVEKNSCSTMHRIHAKPFDMTDFAHEGVDGLDDGNEFMVMTIDALNWLREKFVETNDRKYWRCMIEILPSSYLQKRTVQMSYQALANMYRQRKDHKLTEWHDFRRWIESLPYAEIITTGKKAEQDAE